VRFAAPYPSTPALLFFCALSVPHAPVSTNASATNMMVANKLVDSGIFILRVITLPGSRLFRGRYSEPMRPGVPENTAVPPGREPRPENAAGAGDDPTAGGWTAVHVLEAFVTQCRRVPISKY
jgi:hypothetical protein